MWIQVFLKSTYPDEFWPGLSKKQQLCAKKPMFIKDQYLSALFDKSPPIFKRYGKCHEKKKCEFIELGK